MAAYNADVTLAWTDHGSGPAVLLLHSLGGAGSMWTTTVAALAGRYRVLTLDARGHGLATASGPWSVEQYAADALTLLDVLGIHSATVVGLSMGGQAAMHLALAAPHRVRGLVLADTSLGGRGNAAARMATVRARIEELGEAPFAQEYTCSRLSSSAPEATVQQFARLVEATLPNVYVQQSGSIAGQDLHDAVQGIKVPTLVLVGSHDVSTPPDIAEQLRAAIPNATLAIIENANHLSNLDHPEAFNAAVLHFVAELHVEGIADPSPRFPMLPPSFDDRQQLLHERIMAGPRGVVRGPVGLWLYSPDVAEPAQALGAIVRYQTLFAPLLSELIVLIVAHHVDCAYEWAAHAPIAAAAGISQSVMDAIGAGREPTFDDPKQAVLYRFVRQLLTTNRVDALTFGECRALFGERGVIEATSIMGYYVMAAYALNAVQAPPLKAPSAALAVDNS